MASLEKIEAFIEISQVKARYCRALDTKDWDMLEDLFTEDFVLDVSGSGGPAPISGRDAVMPFIKESLAEAITAHQVHLPEIDLNGDEAKVIFAMQDRVIWGAPKNGYSSLTGYGQYHERYVRQNGQWKIASSRLTRLDLDMEPAPET